jgi:hypothetical protein
MNRELLPDDLLWADGGHASDVVLTALADGQLEIVPSSVRAHVETCTACTQHLGNAALLSLHAGSEITALKEHERALASARRPLPVLAIALGLTVAVLGVVPDFGAIRAYLTQDIPLLAHGAGTLGRRLVEPGGPAGLVVTYGTAALLVAMGFALVRLLPKKETSR